MKLKPFFCLIIIICLFLSVVCFAYNGNVIVYVTDSGGKYHTCGCSYLKSQHAISLEDAVTSGYSACSRCSPPVPDFSYTPSESDPAPKYYSGGSSGVISNNSHNLTTDVSGTDTSTSKEAHLMWLYWLIPLILPYALLFPFSRSLVKSWASLSEHGSYILKESFIFGFPDFGSDFHEFYDTLKRKSFIFYVLFSITAILSLVSISICKIVYFISVAFLSFIAIGQFSAVFISLNANSRVDSDIRYLFDPLVKISYIFAIYQALLLLIFSAFFPLVVF